MIDELSRMGAVQVTELLRRREVLPTELVNTAAARIAETDPQLNALPTLCLERALAHAREIEKRAASNLPPHYLYGLPIAVKDNVEVAGVRTTFGSPIYADHIPAESDIVVQRLEHNGAIVIGKSNLPEFAAGGNTFNEVFGATRNPWDVRMSASGSSGGSAAALASGQVWLATGSDFGGSIRTPASFCSVTGLRPSPGVVAKRRSQPFSPLPVEGPLARSVADVALMLDAEAGPHAFDPLSRQRHGGSYLAAARQPRAPARVAFSVDLGIAPAVDPEVHAVCQAAADRIAAAGVSVESAHPDLRDAERIFQVLRGEIYVARMGALLDEHRDMLKQEIIENTEYGLRLTIAELAAAEIAHGKLLGRMAAFFDDYDLLICPAAICPPFDVQTRYIAELGGVRFATYMGWQILTTAITVTLCPVLALPCGFTAAGLPIGLQVVGRPHGEHALFAHGAWLEQVLGVAGRTPIDPVVHSANDRS
jgi:amidase